MMSSMLFKLLLIGYNGVGKTCLFSFDTWMKCFEQHSSQQLMRNVVSPHPQVFNNLVLPYRIGNLAELTEIMDFSLFAM